MDYAALFVMLVLMAVSAAAGLALIRWIADLRAAQRNFRATVEGLSIRTHQAARAEQARANKSSEVAEVTKQLTQHAAETQDALALERKLRKALAGTPPPLPGE